MIHYVGVFAADQKVSGSEAGSDVSTSDGLPWVVTLKRFGTFEAGKEVHLFI